MNLLIVSDMPHYRNAQEQFLGWGPTVMEIDHLAGLFEEIHHIGFLYDGVPPGSVLPYHSEKITFVPLKPSGGGNFLDKLGVLLKLPSYIAKILKHINHADMLHVRCPSSVGLATMLLVPFFLNPKHRWFKYAGNWAPAKDRSFSYYLQRWLLAHNWPRSLVTINGKWPGQQSHIHSFLNPCLTSSEIEDAGQTVKDKQIRLPLELLFVGRLEDEKGAGRCLEIVQRLIVEQYKVKLTMIGDGPVRPFYEDWIQANGLSEFVEFTGWVPRIKMGEYYSKAHLIIHPSDSSEGWPKVLSEAMAYGVVPVAGAVSSIPQILNGFNVGQALPPKDVDAFVAAVRGYMSDPDRWKRESQAGMDAAVHFTYEAYLEHLRGMFKTEWGLDF